MLALRAALVRDRAQVYARLASFEEDWAAGRVAGWEDRGEGPGAGGAGALIDLEAFEAVEELETLGGDAALPLCSGCKFVWFQCLGCS